jgi:hypothetical protein
MRILGLLPVIGFALTLHAAVCDPNQFQGAFGYQLSGSTTISGTSKPIVTIGRLLFDRGTISGEASVNFAGYFLGNPVTGSYEARTDCTVSWRLQDDSGAYQNFEGTFHPETKTVAFRQTDPGTPRRGTLAQTQSDCSPRDLSGRYRFDMEGSLVLLDIGNGLNAITAKGLLDADGSGGFRLLTPNIASTAGGHFEIENGCIVRFELPGEGDWSPRKFRGVIVQSGDEVLGVETDPATAVRISLVRERTQ